MKPEKAARDPNSSGSRGLPIDAVTGEVYTFDAGDPADFDNLAWLIGGNPTSVYRLGVLLIESATRQGIEEIPSHTDTHESPFKRAS